MGLKDISENPEIMGMTGLGFSHAQIAKLFEQDGPDKLPGAFTLIICIILPGTWSKNKRAGSYDFPVIPHNCLMDLPMIFL